MRGIVLPAALAAALTLVAAAGAADVAAPLAVNLDGDPDLERVVPRELCQSLADDTLSPAGPGCGPDQFARRRLDVEDTCQGSPRVVVISGLQDFVTQLKVENADGATPAPEIFFDARSGASGRVGEARIVRYGDKACGTSRTLFRYPTNQTTGRIPRGAVGRNSFSVSLRDRSKRIRGEELRLTETYVDRDDAFCCPSFRRVTFFRYSRPGDRFVPYRTRAKRIKARGKVGP